MSNLDLNDLWAFNLINNNWKRLEFINNGIEPKKRRFHSSSLVNNKLYIAGGCCGNYVLLGDMYSVDLTSLF